MVHFSYCFCLTLMHSLWQAAVLAAIYAAVNSILKRTAPAAKRNFLYVLLLAQIILSASTFILYYTGSFEFITTQLDNSLQALINSQSNFEIFSPWIISIYSLVVTYKSIQLFFNWKGFIAKNRKAWVKPSIGLKVFTTVKAHHFGIRRKVTLWYSDVISTPLTFGLFKPVILLPVALVNQLSLEETETLIIHELTHIKNNDYLFNWMLIICETIYFFNPFIKFLAREVKLEREKDCDTQVLHFKYPAITYAETLLKTAQFKRSHVPFILAAVLKNSHLLTRIKFFTTEKNLSFHRKNYTHVALVPLAIMLLFNIVLVKAVRVNKAEIAPAMAALQAKLSTISLHEIKQEISPVIDQPLLENKPDYENTVLINTVPPAGPGEPAASTDEQITVPVEYAMPVAVTEIDDTKEVTINEENSATGETTTKVYEMKFKDGEWTAKMKWMLTESKLADSLRILADSLSLQHYRLSLLQQQ